MPDLQENTTLFDMASTLNYSLLNYSGNATNSTSSGEFEDILMVVITVFFTFIVILGLVGNILVIIVVVSNQQMRNTTNLLIINLAFADLFFIIICVPFTAVGYNMPVWPFGSVLCKIYQYTINVTAYASVYTLVLMSLDRYLAVVHPIRSMTLRTVRHCSLVIIISWIIICVVNIPCYLEYDLVPYQFYNEPRSKCLNVKAVDDVYYAKLFTAFFFAFAFVLPLTLVIILYGAMIRRLLRGVRGTSGEVNRGKKRVTKMIISVVAAFTICWIPFHVVQIVNYFGGVALDRYFVVSQIVSTCVAYMNSCINPILYAFLSDNFRKSFRKLLCPSRWEPVRLEIERTCNPAKSVALTTTRTNNTDETTLNNNGNGGLQA